MDSRNGDSGRAYATWGEWLTVLVLLAMAIALAVLNVSLARRNLPPPTPAFDLKNPMLHASPRKCVEMYQPRNPRDAPCISVLENGLVIRPAQGPQRWGDSDGLRLSPPYLACRSRYTEAGSDGCAGGHFLPGEAVVVYPLANFGLANQRRVRPDSIQPRVIEFSGQDRLFYEVVLEDDGGYVWKCYVSPDAPVTGLVWLERLTPRDTTPTRTFYRDIGECP